MLAEKFFLVLETLRSHASHDAPRIVTSPVVTTRTTDLPEVAEAEAGSRSKGPVPDEPI